MGARRERNAAVKDGFWYAADERGSVGALIGRLKLSCLVTWRVQRIVVAKEDRMVKAFRLVLLFANYC